MDFALNNPQRLISHKTKKPNQMKVTEIQCMMRWKNWLKKLNLGFGIFLVFVFDLYIKAVRKWWYYVKAFVNKDLSRDNCNVLQCEMFEYWTLIRHNQSGNKSTI